MTQDELNEAVARLTGETVTTIARMGFSLLHPSAEDDFDPEPYWLDAHTVDWDAADARRLVLV